MPLSGSQMTTFVRPEHNIVCVAIRGNPEYESAQLWRDAIGTLFNASVHREVFSRVCMKITAIVMGPDDIKNFLCKGGNRRILEWADNKNILNFMFFL